MTEQVEQSQEGTPIEQAQISTIEDQAREQGWVPKEDFAGDEAKWVEPGEFIRRGELFKKIDQTTRHAKKVEQTLEQFKSHYLKMQDIANKNALATLKAERKAARDNGDFDKVDEIEEQIEETKQLAEASKAEILATTETPEVHPEVAQWVERNGWYNQDLKMKAFADAAAMELANNGIKGSALLKGIDTEVRKAFPNKFSNPNRERPGAVEGSTNRGSAKADNLGWMTDQDKRIMNKFVEDKVLTREEYISDLKKQKGIK